MTSVPQQRLSYYPADRKMKRRVFTRQAQRKWLARISRNSEDKVEVQSTKLKPSTHVFESKIEIQSDNRRCHFYRESVLHSLLHMGETLCVPSKLVY